MSQKSSVLKPLNLSHRRDGIVLHRQGSLEPTWGADAHCCRSGYVFSLANRWYPSQHPGLHLKYPGTVSDFVTLL